MTKDTILITGGTSGIGLELAKALRAQGHKVIITGRRQALLNQIAAENPGISTYAQDVADATAIPGFVAQVTKDHPTLNMVILNAGVMPAETLSATPSDLTTSQQVIDINLTAPIRLTHALLPHLTAQPSARIVTVSSGLAFVPLAFTPTYSATKAAIHSWSQSLRYQLRDTTVRVTELAPPGVQTDLMPGHATNPAMMPLADFIAEVMGMLTAPEVPDEILVERVKPLRFAESSGKHAEVFAMLHGARH